MDILVGLYITGCWLICIFSCIRAFTKVSSGDFKEAALSGSVAIILFLFLV